MFTLARMRFSFHVLMLLVVAIAVGVVMLQSISIAEQLDRIRRIFEQQPALSHSPIPVPTMPVPPEFFGMHLIDPRNWPTISVGSLGKGTFTSWIYIERTPGAYNWANLDRWVALAAERQIDYFYSFDGFPRWATSDKTNCQPANMPGTYFCGSLPSDLTLIDKFVTALVTRYRGKIKYYELMNEPYGMGPHGVPVVDLVAYAKRVIPIIRSIDPAAKIIAPSMNAPFGWANYAEKYYAAGGPTDVDIISLHAYASKPEDLTPSGKELGPLLSTIAKYGLSQKPIWNTEGGWFGITGKDAPDIEQQIAFVARYCLIHWSEGLTRFYWYAWDNSQWGTLWNSQTGTTGAGLALQQIQNWMIGARLVDRIVPSGTVWSGTFVRRDGTQALAVWNTSGPSIYTAPPRYAKYRDLDGDVHLIKNKQVPIGTRPIWLEEQSTGNSSP